MSNNAYRLKYLKYKNKYNKLKENSYKYLVFNKNFLNETINNYKKKTNNEINKKNYSKI